MCTIIIVCVADSDRQEDILAQACFSSSMHRLDFLTCCDVIIPLLADYLGPVIFWATCPSCSILCLSLKAFNENRNWQLWFLRKFGYQCSQWIDLMLPLSFRNLYVFFSDPMLDLRHLPLDWQSMFFLVQVQHERRHLIPLSIAPYRLDVSIIHPFAKNIFNVQDECMRNACLQLYDHDNSCYDRGKGFSFGHTLQVSWYVCQRGHIAKLTSFEYDGDSPETYSVGSEDTQEFLFLDQSPKVEVDHVSGLYSYVLLECPLGNPQNFTLSVALEYRPFGHLRLERYVERYLADLCWAVV